jgi:hypothetical protein
MNATDYDLSIETCQAEGRLLQCLNPRGQVSDGEKHGDFFPACASPDAGNVTDFPTLPDYPRRDELCTDFAEIYADTTEYANTMNLTGGNGALFQFSLVDGDRLKGRLAFNGIFGYLSFGFVGPDYPTRNAMYEGRVLMAMRGGNYTASRGRILFSPKLLRKPLLRTPQRKRSQVVWSDAGYINGHFRHRVPVCYTLVFRDYVIQQPLFVLFHIDHSEAAATWTQKPNEAHNTN